MVILTFHQLTIQIQTKASHDSQYTRYLAYSDALKKSFFLLRWSLPRPLSGVAQSESEKAAEFNLQFTDVFTKSEQNQVPLLDKSAPFMEDIVVTKEGVTKLLKGLNPTKALRPDELHRIGNRVMSRICPSFPAVN